MSVANVSVNAITNLNEGVKMVRLGRLFAQNDKLAHAFSVLVTKDGSTEDLTGLLAMGYFIRADDSTVNVEGSVSGGTVTLTLPAACYEVPGHFSLMIKVYDTTHSTAVFWGDGTVTRTETDNFVDASNVIPDIQQLLAQIAAMEEATEGLSGAIESVNSAISDAGEATTAANSAASAANSAAATVNTAVSEANAAASAANAAAQQVTDAIVPQFSIGTVTDVPAAQGAGASVTGTARNPVLNLQIPRGLDGSGSVASVGGVSPDGNGNVPLSVAGVTPNTSTGNIPLTAADVDAVPETREVNGHALSSDVTLTASDVGAVPPAREINGHALSSDVTLTASDVGAVAGDYCYTVEVTTSGWTNGGTTTGYTKTVTVSGLTDADVATLALLATDASTVAAKRAAFSCLYRAVSGEDSLTLYATATPSESFTLGIKVVR